MELVTEHRQNNKQFYFIPHHAVFKESSGPTKLGVVLDCKAKPQNGLYLNNTILVGPCIQQDFWTNVEKLKRSLRVMMSDKPKDVQIIWIC